MAIILTWILIQIHRRSFQQNYRLQRCSWPSSALWQKELRMTISKIKILSFLGTQKSSSTPPDGASYRQRRKDSRKIDVRCRRWEWCLCRAYFFLVLYLARFHPLLSSLGSRFISPKHPFRVSLRIDATIVFFSSLFYGDDRASPEFEEQPSSRVTCCQYISGFLANLTGSCGQKWALQVPLWDPGDAPAREKTKAENLCKFIYI